MIGVRRAAARIALAALALAALYALWLLRITLTTPMWWGGTHPRVLLFVGQLVGTAVVAIAALYVVGRIIIRLFKEAGW